MDACQPVKYPPDHVTYRYLSNIRIDAVPSDTGIHYNFDHVLSC